MSKQNRSAKSAAAKNLTLVAVEASATTQTAPVAAASASEVQIEGLDDLLARKKQLEAEVKAKKASGKNSAWETEAKAKNPQYVVGSLRTATPADLEVFAKRGSKCHGIVCEITCAKCGKQHLVNKQDAKQSRFCDECVKAARRQAAKDKRVAKANSPEKLKEQIAALQAKLETASA